MKIEEAIKQKKFKSEHQKLMVNISFTNGYLIENTSKVLKPYDISIQQYNVLRILRGQMPEAVSVNVITERMVDKMSNASRLVEKLRKKGFIERKTCPIDQRKVAIIITKSGLKVLSDLEHKMEVLGKNICHLKNAEVKLLNELLDKLRTA